MEMLEKRNLVLSEMPLEVRKLVEYKMAENRLQQKVTEITNKYLLPGINYETHWNLEFEVRDLVKNNRGW